jgi:hypothetical protein
MNQGPAGKEITQDHLSCTAQTYIRTDENLWIQDFSIDIQQAEGQHMNIQEMQGNVHKGVGMLHKEKWHLLIPDFYIRRHFQIHKTGLGWSLSIRGSLQACK